MKNRFTSRLLSKSLPPLFVLGALANISYAQTTRTWDGGGVPATNMDLAANWSVDTVPNGATSDTAQWDGTVAGPLSLTYTALTTGAGLAAAPGFFFNVLGTQTSPLTINEFSGTAGLRIQNMTVASGAGALTFGGLAGADYLTLGSAALLTHTWTNNSANAVTFASDVLFGAGGGVTHGLTFTGTGNWNVNTTLIKSGTGTINVIKDGTGSLNIGTVNSLGNAAFTMTGGTIDNTSGAALALTVVATTPTAYTFNGDFSYGTAAGTSLNDLSLGVPPVGLGAAPGTSRTITTNGGGLLTVAGVISNGTTANSLIKSGTGALRLDGANTFTGGTTLNSGILHIANNGALGTGPFTINGGTIQPRLVARTLPNPTTVNGDFTLGVNGANNQINLSGTVNLGGATRTITVVDTTINPDSNFTGVVSNGGLTKAGGGSLILSAVNTYAGATTIAGGLLQVTGAGSIGSTSGITINGTDSKLLLTSSVATPAPINLIQGTLDATGTVGAVSVGGANPTILANGNGGTGTLTTGALSFAGPSTVNVFSAPGVPAITAGTLTTSGTASAIAINITRTAPWTNGPNNLIAYSSSSANINEFTYNLASVPALGARQSIPDTGALVKNGNNIALQVNGTTIYWTGLKSNQWTTSTIGTPKNWKQTSDNTATDALDLDDVVFADNPTTTNQTVQIDDNDVFPTTTTFNNSTVNYTFASASGIYGIAGVGPLTKNGTGSLTLTTINNYSGGTTLNAGTINVNSTAALGVGSVTINGGTLNNTSGSAVILTNNSAQNWNGDFTFTGTNALDMGNGAVTGGGTGDRTVTVSAGNLTVGELKTAAGQSFIKQGTGTLQLSSTGANTASSVINGTLTVAAGTLQLNRADAASIDGTGDIVTSGLAGTGTITNGSNFERWVITTATGTFGGKLLNGGTGGLGFNKTGTGTLTLTAANGYSGATTVNGGTLSITGTNSLGGPVNVNGNATTPAILNLQNSGAVGAAVVTSANRNSGIQLLGGINLAANVSFVTSGDGTSGATVPYAIDSFSGNNTINGNISLVAGGGGSVIQSDAGSSLTLTGNITVGAAQTSRGIILQGDSTTGNLFSGVLSDLSVTAIANIVKAGTGTWTVSGTNTYTGPTAVNAGTLIVSGNSPAATGTTTVATGATLGGNGSFGGPLVVAAGGHHALAVAATPGAQVIRQVASLDLTGLGDILDLTAAATPANGTYTLVHTTTGTITGQTAGVLDDTVVNLNGLTGTVAVVGGDLVLTVGAVTSPFSTWIAGYPSIPVADRDPGDDPDGDGNSNMVEFALGGTPNNGSDNAKIYSIVADSDFDVDTTKELLMTIAVRTGTGTFTGTTSKSAPSDDPAYSYTVQGSLDLVTFGQTVNVVPTAIPPVGATLPTGYTWKTFSLEGSNGTPTKGFLRVTVTH